MTQEIAETTKILRRFWSKIDRGSQGECWNWLKGKNSSGYGSVWMRDKQLLAHRVAYELTNGPIPEGLCVLHSCDNPACCNPAHLRVGTQAENLRQRDERCRSRGTPRKLTMQQAREIRALAGRMKVRQLAKKFGAAPTTVDQIIKGKSLPRFLGQRPRISCSR